MNFELFFFSATPLRLLASKSVFLRSIQALIFLGEQGRALTFLILIFVFVVASILIELQVRKDLAVKFQPFFSLEISFLSLKILIRNVIIFLGAISLSAVNDVNFRVSDNLFVFRVHVEHTKLADLTFFYALVEVHVFVWRHLLGGIPHRFQLSVSLDVCVDVARADRALIQVNHSLVCFILIHD